MNCIIGDTSRNLISVLKGNHVAKEGVIRAFKDEARKEKPNWRVLVAALYVLNEGLRNWNRDFYNSSKVMKEVKYCHSEDKRSRVKRAASEHVLRLFLSFYHEYCRIKSIDSKDKHLLTFKKIYKEKDIERSTEVLDIFNDKTPGFGKTIFEHHGFKFHMEDIEKTQRKFKETLREFYNS